ncbi:thioredoxin-2-like [Lucilia sericata]|uniref:thioredoxin-2-like n=1 Tax=Lucilia sericata TaxID=13632 RepID=UPI0018A819EA|nr:thioredoxin-2-like [Lucilia sericata]
MAYNVLNKNDFELELEDADGKLVIIDFYANWCAPCKIINPQLEELSVQYANKVKFLKVNVDDCEDIAMAYNVTSMPTFVFVRDQQIIDVLVGGNVEKLVKNMEKYMKEDGDTIEKYTGVVEEVEEGLEVEDFELENDLDVESLPEDPSAVLEIIVDESM